MLRRSWFDLKTAVSNCQAFTEIKEKVRAFILRKGRLTLQDGEAILGYGRNRTVPVLDYLDSTGFTRRIGNDRVLGM